MEKLMKMEQNPLTGDWLCWIPNTPQAYYCSTKKAATKFVNAVNKAFHIGEITFNDDGELILSTSRTKF